MRTFTRLALVFAIVGGSLGALPAAAAEPTPAPRPAWADAAVQIFLPFVAKPSPYLITGQVTDQSGSPLAGVAVTGSSATAQTGADGSYALGSDGGQLAVAPYKEGFTFDPPMIDLTLNSSVTEQDFTALTACTEKAANNSFESSTWWNLMEGSGLYPSSYSTSAAHSGSRSGRVGIVNPADRPTNPSGLESRIRSQPIYINPGSTTTLRLWLMPVSTEAVAKPAEPSAAGDSAPTSAFGDATMAADAQYVRLLNGSDAQLATLLQIRSNNGFWTMHQFDLSAYAGQTVKIEVGVYNDAYDGVTAMYVDDVSLSVCAGTPPPPPPPPGPCYNQVVNGAFEYNGSWGIPYTAYPAAYSYDSYHSYARSMRTGIPLTYGSGNTYSYSDAWQNVVIPAGSSATLKMWLYPRSEEPGAMSLAEEDLAKVPNVDESAPKFAEGQVWDEKALAPEVGDAQYVLILNPSTGAILETLLWWGPRNSSVWVYKEFNLSAYAGRTIRVQFGTYNNGTGGRSVMYVDDVELYTCGSTPPPPPPVCTEVVRNGGFENNNAWYIPQTDFSAGYSTFLWKTGVRSMRTGIYYSYHNRYSYSDASQTVTIPSSASSATLRAWVYRMTTPYARDAGASAGAEEAAVEAPVPDGTSPTDPRLGMAAVSGDVQYILVLDTNGYWLDTLLWDRSSSGWTQLQYNLSRFRGQTIRLQFGTYNNGYGGVTSMYVDDVSLVACP